MFENVDWESAIVEGIIGGLLLGAAVFLEQHLFRPRPSIRFHRATIAHNHNAGYLEFKVWLENEGDVPGHLLGVTATQPHIDGSLLKFKGNIHRSGRPEAGYVNAYLGPEDLDVHLDQVGTAHNLNGTRDQRIQVEIRVAGRGRWNQPHPPIRFEVRRENAL